MKSILKFILPLFMVFTFSACQQQEPNKIKVGIIVPVEHQALQEIVAGFSETLREIYHQPLQIKVMNAQGDANLQRAIIQQMRDQNFTLIAPVATGVTQMTASMVKNQPIVGLAADFSNSDRNKLNPCNITVVQDEIPPKKLIHFLHAVYPEIKHLTLLHSTSDKIFPDVKATINAGKKLGIEVKPIMVATLPELVSATQALPEETQGIFILKDNLMASGIATLVKTANEKHILLFTSDQGTVEEGAGISLGVHERAIGEEGAKLAAAILNGKNACDLPITKMKNLTVFVNKKALELQRQSTALIDIAAKELDYTVELVSR